MNDFTAKKPDAYRVFPCPKAHGEMFRDAQRRTPQQTLQPKERPAKEEKHEWYI